MKAAQFKNRLVLILFLKLAYELFENLFAFLKICFKIKMNGGLRSKGMREYFLLALLILTSLFPKPSLGGHQSILNPECTPCHSQNRIQQHGGFCAPSCTACHDSQQVNIRETIAKGKLGLSVHCIDCHGQVDHSLAHDQTFLPGADCANCHAANVAVEHGNRGLNCYVCHGSPDPQVQSAISYGRAGNPIYCSACHVIDHTSAHERSGQSGLTLPECGICHVDNIATEHLNHSLNCETCHASDNPVVQAAISKGIGGTLANCDDCHQRDEYDYTHHNQTGPGCLDCHDVHGWPPYKKWPP
jgi:hypothetical protein